MELNKYIDHTLLKPEATHEDIHRVCEEAKAYNTASVCVNPRYAAFVAKELQVPIFLGGKQVYQSPALPEIRQYCKEQIATLWPEVLRFDNPHNYYVDLSYKLLGIKMDLLNHGRG